MKGLQKTIASGKIAPVYFFYGPESFLKEEMTELVRKKAFSAENEAALNTTVLYAGEQTLGEIVSKASEFPMFAPRKLLVVKQFEKYKKQNSRDRQQRSLEQFIGYLDRPADSTILILDADQIDRKELGKPPFSALKPFRHDFPAIKNPAVFAAERARLHGWEFDPDALQTFTAHIQPSAREITREIEKLVMYALSRSGEKRISSPDVYDCVGISKQYNVFELEKRLAEKNLRLCSGISLMIMEREGQREGLMNIVRYLTTFYMRIWKLHAPGVRKQSLSETAKMLGMFGKQEYFAKNYLQYASRFSLKETERALMALQKTDAALKGLESYPDEKFLLLRLMQQLLDTSNKV